MSKKYAEGTVSPSGKFVVQDGQWAPVPSATASAGGMAPEDRRHAEFMAGSKVASAPYSEPTDTGRAIGSGIETATMLAAGGGALGAAARGVGGVLGGAARVVSANPNAALGVASAAPELLRGDVKGAAGTAVMTVAGLKGSSKLLKFLSKFGKSAQTAAPATKAGFTEAEAAAVRDAAKQKYAELVAKGEHYTPEFKKMFDVPRAGTAKVLPEGQRAMATNLGGKAKPGPAPTKPEDLEATLKKSLEALPKNASSVLKGPRIEVGAQKVGKAAGMTKEEVRRQTGPVLDEALGEASPILPKAPLQKIIDTMRQIPPAEREAYVARATSGKAKAQIENIRRTLEHLGLLIPAAAVAGETIGGKRD